MPHTDKNEAGFEDLWDRMERLAKSGDETERRSSRILARRLLSYTELPRSYAIRAHMALASLACAQDALHEAEDSHAKIPVKVPSKLQAELQITREAYKSKETEEMIVIEGDEEPIDLTVECGTQEEPIDLTLEHDPTPFENTSGKSYVDPACDHVEGAEVRSTGFSLWPRFKRSSSYTHQHCISSKQ
ncbi:hypothetical protein KCU91_g18242, partial [Aureobasidium melanogenum]